jgi:hypothetical protein
MMKAIICNQFESPQFLRNWKVAIPIPKNNKII